MGRYATFNGLATAALFAAALLACPVAAQEVATAERWDGFRPTAEIALPFAAVAQASVVRIEATYVRRAETTAAAIPTVATRNEPAITDHGVLDADKRLMQIETCRRQGLDICPILSVEGSGSGFFDGGRDLYTCRHVVGDWPLAASLLNDVPIKGIVPPLLLRDALGVVVYNSAYSDAPLRFAALNEDPRLDTEAILRYRALAGQPLPASGVAYPSTLPFLLKASDFVGLRADDDLVAPVALRPRAATAPGEVFYLSGYPTRTGLDPFASNDMPSRQLVSSVLTTEALGDTLPLIMARGLQRPGGSGGIVTTADGEVVGMSCFADAGNAYAFSFDTSAQARFWADLRTGDYADVLAGVPREAAAHP